MYHARRMKHTAPPETSISLYLALLRGINVGGQNLIKMADLRVCFEAMDFERVQTYIQSGNVIFAAAEDLSALETRIEQRLQRRFAYDACVVVVSYEMLTRIVSEAPPGFGREPKVYRYDVLFLKAPLVPAQAIAALERREGVDDAYVGTHAVYFRRLAARLTQSRFSRIAAKPEYKLMTIRNWNTTTRLLALMNESFSC